MEKREKIFLWLALTRAKGLGRISLKRLWEHFKDVEKIYNASEKELMQVEGIKSGIKKEMVKKEHLEFGEDEVSRCDKLGVKLIALDSDLYPRNLLQIADPAPVLYVKGELKKEDERAVAVVGSRNINDYGEVMAKRIGSGLARFGITVVSGMARGIDSISQKSALEAGGRSIAVLGTGINQIYPSEHKELYERIAEKGAVISEFALDTGPNPENFPQRNRIISGLCLGVVIVQANNERSGALITARHALDQGRTLYAVPGNAGSVWSKETNRLIKQGAILVEGAEDVVFDLFPSMGLKEEEIGPLFSSGDGKTDLTTEQERLYVLIPEPEEGAVELDYLIRKSGISASNVQSFLTELELFGLIEKISGGKWRKKKIAQ